MSKTVGHFAVARTLPRKHHEEVGSTMHSKLHWNIANLLAIPRKPRREAVAQFLFLTEYDCLTEHLHRIGIIQTLAALFVIRKIQRIGTISVDVHHFLEALERRFIAMLENIGGNDFRHFYICSLLFAGNEKHPLAADYGNSGFHQKTSTVQRKDYGGEGGFRNRFYPPSPAVSPFPPLCVCLISHPLFNRVKSLEAMAKSCLGSIPTNNGRSTSQRPPGMAATTKMDHQAAEKNKVGEVAFSIGIQAREERLLAFASCSPCA
ncbi:uncharacterized protein TNCT_377001 [Trichonephila clavata]|uniref:Uncharacterized protein n=1 Tax=Trichonephila clavata TaxID=2740835 RepID=A0A8X6G9U6_TRICU|nr:uncharacterized protein TNCT_377001 [Trichonephila clavata]